MSEDTKPVVATPPAKAEDTKTDDKKPIATAPAK